ncbi:MAG TPA: SEC-C metal-binding domain-containing protein [Elusimicrobiota bacterium]|nr:SEC-C metal-binding domain-containing protein [Elusimicrobiota bacterium]
MFEKIKSKLTSSNGDMPSTLGRNEPCHCGSGKKYKKCHLPQDEEAERKKLVKEEIPPIQPDKEGETDKTEHKKHSDVGGPAAGTKAGGGFMRSIFNRKAGGGS